jgi:hypothetical protein
VARWPACLVPTTQDDLQNSRDGNCDNDAQQAKERPTNQNSNHHYDGMQPCFPAHDAWAQIYSLHKLLQEMLADG